MLGHKLLLLWLKSSKAQLVAMYIARVYISSYKYEYDYNDLTCYWAIHFNAHQLHEEIHIRAGYPFLITSYCNTAYIGMHDV